MRLQVFRIDRQRRLELDDCFREPPLQEQHASQLVPDHAVAGILSIAPASKWLRGFVVLAEILEDHAEEEMRLGERRCQGEGLVERFARFARAPFVEPGARDVHPAVGV